MLLELPKGITLHNAKHMLSTMGLNDFSIQLILRIAIRNNDDYLCITI